MAIAPNVYHWRTVGGAEVDLVIEWKGKFYLIEAKCKTNLTRSDLTGMNAFRKTYDHVMPGLVVYAGNECYKLDAQTTAVPWNLL